MAADPSRAAAVAAIDAETSAVLLAIPLPRGSELETLRLTSTSERPKCSNVNSTARRDFGASGGAQTLPVPADTSTDAVAYISIGQLTRKWLPPMSPCTNSPQLPGNLATAVETHVDVEITCHLAANRRNFQGCSDSRSELQSRLGLDSLFLVRVLDLTHLGNEVGELHECIRRVPARDDDVQHVGFLL